MKTRTFSIGGIHVPEMKEKLLGSRILTMPLPMQVSIPLRQHVGAPATPVVQKGDKVTRGQKIAEITGRMGAPVHASISGTVKDIAPVTNTAGMPEPAITIVADEESHQADLEAIAAMPTFDYSQLTPEELVAAIADAGVTGLGGATFPTAIKLTPPPGCKAEILLINGAECEPCLTCDDALMNNHAAEVAEGVNMLRKAAKVDRAIIGIENNKPQAIAAMTAACAAYPQIEVQPLRTKYPQGGEKQLIYALTGKEVQSGKLPISVGCVVVNVGTAYAVYMAIAHHRPLIERIVTMGNIGNCLVPLGVSLAQVKEYVESEASATLPNEGVWDVVIGGPMMGRSAINLDAPVTKGTSGVTYYTPVPFDPQPCLRCGECVQACPMGLEPYLLAVCGRKGLIDQAADSGAMDCIECGSCNYSCPSGRPIVDYIRHAKTGIRKRNS